MAAIPEARRALEDVGLVDEIDLVVAGGIRNGGDVAKCLALGANAVAIGHSALMALNCNKEIPGVTDYEGTVGVPAGQCYHCHTGRCPVVRITTQDPELRKRLHVEEAANRVYNFLHTLTLEVQMLARACGKTNVHTSSPRTSRRSRSRPRRWPACRWPAPTTSRASPRSARSTRSRRCSTATSRTRSTGCPSARR